MQLNDHNLLRVLREMTGLSQATLASTLKMDRSYYSRMERGERPVDVDLVKRVADLAGVRVVVVRPQDDALLASLHELKAPDLAIVAKLIDLLPNLHPLRKTDLAATLDNWSRSSPSIQASDEVALVKKM